MISMIMRYLPSSALLAIFDTLYVLPNVVYRANELFRLESDESCRSGSNPTLQRYPRLHNCKLELARSWSRKFCMQVKVSDFYFQHGFFPIFFFNLSNLHSFEERPVLALNFTFRLWPQRSDLSRLNAIAL